MPNLVKIALFFLIAFSLCPIGVVFGLKCYSTVHKFFYKNKIGWDKVQHGFWDAESVHKVIGEAREEDGERANLDHCLVMIYEITPKEGSDKKFKIWKSLSGKDYCTGDERKQMEKWANEAGGTNFRCWTCNDGDYCNDKGLRLFCYDTVWLDKKSTDRSYPYTKDWKQMQKGFREVVSVDEVDEENSRSVIHTLIRAEQDQDSCLSLAYQITPEKGSKKKFKIWKGLARNDYCESDARKRVEEWVKNAGGFNFKCSTCNAMEKDNCNAEWPKMRCWDKSTYENGHNQLMRNKLDYLNTIKLGFDEVSSKAASLPRDNDPRYDDVNDQCSAYSGCLMLSYKKGSKYAVWKSCAPAVDYCESPKKKELEEIVKKEGGHDFRCSICDRADNCNDKLPSQKCWRTNDSINDGFVNASNLDATVGKANSLCPQETPHCVMQSCSKKNGSGILIRQGCSAGDYELLKDDNTARCGKDVEEKERKHCGEAKDYKCGMCYAEDNCNVQPVHCWQTPTKPPQANDNTMYIEAPSKFVVVGQRKKCPLHLRTCTTEFCYLENSVLVRKSCAEPNYCKGSSPEYKEMKKICTDKRGDYECKQCHGKDNCNGENSTRQCWSTIKSGPVNIEEFDVKEKFKFGAAENVQVGDPPRQCSEEQATCITEICKISDSNFLISKGCGPVDYCAGKEYPKMNESRNYCLDEKKGVYSCYACHDNDNCNVPWQGPPPAPKEPEPEPSAPSVAGTTGKWHHGMMTATWMLILFMSSVVPLSLI